MFIIYSRGVSYISHDYNLDVKTRIAQWCLRLDDVMETNTQQLMT